jgi:phosphatidylserine/phosphatidylglycerophosphate/cardiolipin synthase-like enzyme
MRGKTQLPRGPMGILSIVLLAAYFIFTAFQPGGTFYTAPTAGVRPTLPVAVTAAASIQPGTLSPTSRPATQTNMPVATTIAASKSPFQVWFTDPSAPNASRQIGGPDEVLIAAIDKATQTVDMAMFNFTFSKVADALVRAKNRQVRVRLVMESESMDNAAVTRIKSAGIPVVGDNHEGLMHNKFTVIDGKSVWTGSLNMSGGGIYNDNNNLLLLPNEKIAQDYTTEFEEMFTQKQFGPDSPANTPYPVVMVDGRRVEVYFSPDDKISPRLVELIGSAKTSVEFLAYAFTSNPLADALIARHKAGVSVRGVFDASQYESNIGGEYDNLKQFKLDVRLDKFNGLMHHKVIIIDRKVVVTGSYNFTSSADKTNDENVVIVYDPDLAQLYAAEFERIFAASK